MHSSSFSFLSASTPGAPYSCNANSFKITGTQKCITKVVYDGFVAGAKTKYDARQVIRRAAAAAKKVKRDAEEATYKASADGKRAEDAKKKEDAELLAAFNLRNTEAALKVDATTNKARTEASTKMDSTTAIEVDKATVALATNAKGADGCAGKTRNNNCNEKERYGWCDD